MINSCNFSIKKISYRCNDKDYSGNKILIIKIQIGRIVPYCNGRRECAKLRSFCCNRTYSSKWKKLKIRTNKKISRWTTCSWFFSTMGRYIQYTIALPIPNSATDKTFNKLEYRELSPLISLPTHSIRKRLWSMATINMSTLNVIETLTFNRKK